MYKKLINIVGLMLISTCFLIGCGELKNNIGEIKTITLAFSGNPIDSYSCVLTEKQNIEESMKIYQKLLTYKSPDVCTWKEDVTYQIEYNDGKMKSKTFKGIRPVSDLYKNIFNSLEVRKQWESIFKIVNDDVSYIKLISRQKKNEAIMTDRKDIDNIINSVRSFEENINGKDNDYLAVCDIEFYNTNEGRLGRVVVFREDINTNEILADLNILSDLLVSPDDIRIMTLENEGNKKIIIDDKDIMQIVLDNYHHGFTSQKSIVSVHIDLKNDDRAHMYGSFYKNEVPEMIKKLFK